MILYIYMYMNIYIVLYIHIYIYIHIYTQIICYICILICQELSLLANALGQDPEAVQEPWEIKMPWGGDQAAG